jgi:hypothetical protein
MAWMYKCIVPCFFPPRPQSHVSAGALHDPNAFTLRKEEEAGWIPEPVWMLSRGTNLSSLCWQWSEPTHFFSILTSTSGGVNRRAREPKLSPDSVSRRTFTFPYFSNPGILVRIYN